MKNERMPEFWIMTMGRGRPESKILNKFHNTRIWQCIKENDDWIARFDCPCFTVKQTEEKELHVG